MQLPAASRMWRVSRNILYIFIEFSLQGGGADKKLDSLRAPKGVELKCIRRTKLMLP